MKILKQMLVACLAIAAWNTALADTPQWVPSGTEGVDTSTPEALASTKGKKVFVEFVNSPKLTTIFSDAFTKSGAIVVQTADEADMTVHLEGKYKAIRPATGRRGEVDIGTQMEKAGDIVTKDHQTGIWISQGVGNLTPLQTSGVVSAVDLFARATGFRDWFNSKVSGDPDGVCLANCDSWKYKQEALIVIGLKEKGQDNYASTSAFRSQATEKELIAGQLIDKVLNTALSFSAGTGKINQAGL